MLDEIRRVPELLSWIQVEVDEKKQMGHFVLTGSHQFELSREISQSLAGRTALLKLLEVHRVSPAAVVRQCRQAPDQSDAMRPAQKVAGFLGERVQQLALVYGGDVPQKRSEFTVLPYFAVGSGCR
nr:AAA family ATPase [Thiothrix nivea]